MENSKKPEFKIKRYVPKTHKVLSIFAALLILIGIIQSVIFFQFSIAQTLILAIILLTFYAILIAVLLKPKTKKIYPKKKIIAKKLEQTESIKEIAKEIKKPARKKKSKKKSKK